LIMGVKVVKGLDEAIAHINNYGTHHSDSILTTTLAKPCNSLKKSIPPQSTGMLPHASLTATNLGLAQKSALVPKNSM